MERPTQDSERSSTPELARACRDGDPAAWAELLDRYERMVFAIACREGLSLDDAADVTQITFESLLAQMNQIRDDTQIASWLMTVARRQAWRIRNDRIKQVPDESLTMATGPEPEASDPITQHSIAMWVYEGLADLDARCRDLITALYFDPGGGGSYAEIASRLGRPVGSIGPTRARCLERLRRLLGDMEWE